MSEPRLTVSERRRRRQRFLELLYESVEGDTGSIVNLQDVGAEMGLSPEDSWDVRAYLQSEGYIQGVTGAGGICITHEGVRLVESWTAGPDHRLHPESEKGNVVNIGTAVNSQIQQGTSGSSMSMTVSHQTLEDIRGLVNELRGSLDELGLSEEDRDEVEAQLATTEAQTTSRKPRMEVIKAALGDVKEILEGVVASAAASAKIVGTLGALRALLGGL